MKRSCIGHTKLKKLAARLQSPTYIAVGILESLWHLTAREAPFGDIGKMSDEDICLGIDWQGDPAEFIGALVDAGWIDRSDTHRLVIHDWHDHADDAVKRFVSRRGGVFASQNSEVTEHVATCRDKSEHDAKWAHKPVPEPVPVPVPEPVPMPEPEPGGVHVLSGRWPVNHLASIFSAYPKRVKPLRARTAIDAALCAIAAGPDPPDDPFMWLLGRVQAFAASPAGKSGYLQDPHNWFDDGRYLEDEAQWQARDGAADASEEAERLALKKRLMAASSRGT